MTKTSRWAPVRTVATLVTLVTLGVLVLAGADALHAQPQPQSPPSSSPALPASSQTSDPTAVTRGGSPVPPAAQDAYVPFRPGEGGSEVLPAAPFVFIVYAFVWVALLAYVLSLAMRLRRVQDELANVNARLEKDARR